MRANALVPAENMAAGRSEQEISLNSRAILLALPPVAGDAQGLRCSPPCWATGALSPVDPLEAGSRGVADRDAAQLRQLGPCPR